MYHQSVLAVKVFSQLADENSIACITRQYWPWTCSVSLVMKWDCVCHQSVLAVKAFSQLADENSIACITRQYWPWTCSVSLLMKWDCVCHQSLLAVKVFSQLADENGIVCLISIIAVCRLWIPGEQCWLSVRMEPTWPQLRWTWPTWHKYVKTCPCGNTEGMTFTPRSFHCSMLQVLTCQ